MSKVVAAVQSFALALGAPGLFLVALLDSSFLSLPQVNDILLIWMVAQKPSMWWVYAGMSTLGSVAGCLVMYLLARKGGERLLRKWMSAERIEKAHRTFSRYGLMAVLVPSILPPPAPFKIFVILAGVSKMSPWSFAIAILLGRGFRYFGEGLLAVWYGEQALAFLETNGRQVALWTGLTVLGVGAAYFWWRSRRPATVAPAPPA
jgi:membrane protein YqaA with SNARE-associated domain